MPQCRFAWLLQVCVFSLFAYSSYLVAEVLSMSGIMSVFFCGVVMAHYNWYNLSASARLITSQAFQSISYAAEMFVFCYMGFSVWTLSFEATLPLHVNKGFAQWSPQVRTRAHAL
jgi:NhaP-type Na+/H+ or K+/H+ antiporter|eukprot:SAG25_NODE_1533_length_2831_cov_6.960835_3_plen_115_part_00